jgi:hypothetical protein
MLIDIIEAYADAMHVATTLRAPPTPPRDGRHWSREADVQLAPSPAAWRRIAGWLGRWTRPADDPDAGMTGTPTALKGCG